MKIYLNDFNSNNLTSQRNRSRSTHKKIHDQNEPLKHAVNHFQRLPPPQSRHIRFSNQDSNMNLLYASNSPISRFNPTLNYSQGHHIFLSIQPAPTSALSTQQQYNSQSNSNNHIKGNSHAYISQRNFRQAKPFNQQKWH